MSGAAVPRFDTLTIYRPEPAELARLYGALLERPVPDGDGDYVAVLTRPVEVRPSTFQRQPTSWP